MAEQQQQLSLGRYLQSQRVKRGLGIDVVSRRTHISKQNLIRIEAEDYAGLPAPVHVKGFLRSYAQLLEINPDRVLQRYAEELVAWKNPAGPYGLSGRFGFWPRFLFAICVLAAVIAVTLFSATHLDRDSQQSRVKMTNVADKEEGATEKETRTVKGRADAPASTEAAETSIVSKLKLRVVTIESTKLKVIIDGRAPRTYQLKPEQRLELEAESHFNLLLDNAPGVDLYFNEKPVNLSGKAGQNVTIQLP